MAPPRRLSPQSVWDTSAVLQAFKEEGIKPLHAVRMWGHLIRHPEATWHDVPDMPRAALALLDKYFAKFTTRVTKAQTSRDGTTTKLLVELQDGMQVEAVVMTYDAPSRDPQLLAASGPIADPCLPVDHADRPDDDQPEAHQQQHGEEWAECMEDWQDDEEGDADQQQQQGLGQGAEHGEQGTGCCGGSGRKGEGEGCCGGGGERKGAEGRAQGEAERCSGRGAGSEGEGPSGEAADAAAAAAAAALRARKRSTLCVSSQVGCQMGCTFCATGTMGLKGHLNAGEIVEQLLHARAVTRIRNIVFMGMGEPLNNYEAVRCAVSMMTDSRFFGLRRRHVTVSTVGVIPRIKQLAQDLPGVSLALSLHAPTQELRLQIVPSARAFKLSALMQAVREYQATSSQRVFYEYVMLAGVNDGEEQAHQLGQLLQGDDAVINLIPWNPIYQPEGPFFNAPREGSVATFQGILRHTYGLHTTIRQEMGQDISGACGQLVLETGAGGGGCSREATRDIEDGMRRAKLDTVA